MTPRYCPLSRGEAEGSGTHSDSLLKAHYDLTSLSDTFYLFVYLFIYLFILFPQPVVR